MSMTHEEEIIDFQQTILDFELSPFETLECLHIRSSLREKYSQLTMKERALLLRADALVMENVEEISEHLRKAYNFSCSTEPYDEWWWHLDKVEQGKLKVTFNITTTVSERE